MVRRSRLGEPIRTTFGPAILSLSKRWGFCAASSVSLCPAAPRVAMLLAAPRFVERRTTPHSTSTPQGRMKSPSPTSLLLLVSPMGRSLIGPPSSALCADQVVFWPHRFFSVALGISRRSCVLSGAPASRRGQLLVPSCAGLRIALSGVTQSLTSCGAMLCRASRCAMLHRLARRRPGTAALLLLGQRLVLPPFRRRSGVVGVSLREVAFCFLSFFFLSPLL